jgi:uncharacterized FlaG/YvyC family protein
MTNNIHSIEDRVRQGRKQRMDTLAKGQVAHLRQTDAATAERGRLNEARSTVRRRLEEEIRKVYVLYVEADAGKVVEQIHAEVRKSRGVAT